MNSQSKGVVAAIIIVIVVVAAVGLYYYFYMWGGQVNVYLTDPGSRAAGTNTSAPMIYIAISSIIIHSESGAWITISNVTRTVELSSALSLIATKTLPPGNYTEVRLVVKAVTVEVGGVNFSASLPSGVLKIPIINGGLEVKRGATAYLVIYMGPHLAQTGTGQYILRPVMTAVAYYSPPSANTTTTTNTTT